MKSLVALFVALGLSVPLATAALSDPTDRVSCEAHGMIWDEETQTCVSIL